MNLNPMIPHTAPIYEETVASLNVALFYVYKYITYSLSVLCAITLNSSVHFAVSCLHVNNDRM